MSNLSKILTNEISFCEGLTIKLECPCRCFVEKYKYVTKIMYLLYRAFDRQSALKSDPLFCIFYLSAMNWWSLTSPHLSACWEVNVVVTICSLVVCCRAFVLFYSELLDEDADKRLLVSVWNREPYKWAFSIYITLVSYLLGACCKLFIMF